MNKKVLLNFIKKSFRKILLSSMMTLSLQSLIAQDSIQSHDLEEVIISASRSEQNVKDVGRSITVISQDDIQKSVYSDVSDLLSQQEGINIIGTGQTPGSLQRIYMRGAGINHTVILIDGIRITDPSTVDNAVDLSELSLANIERIEIVRGAHSTLYGSSAIGGVVNIITKRNKKEGLNANAQINAGTFGTSTSVTSENLHLNYTSKSGIYASGEIYYTNVKGLDATIDTITDPAVFKNRDNDNFDKTDWIAKIGFKNKKWDVFASYKSTNQKTDIDDGAYNDDDNHVVDYDRKLISYQTSYNPINNIQFKFLGGYTELIRSVTNDSSVIDNTGAFDHSYAKDNFYGTVLNNEFQANYFRKGLSILLAAGSYEETMNSNSFYTNTAWALTLENNLDSLNIRSRTNTAFMHMNLNGSIFSKNLKFIRLAIGGRLNDHSTYGSFYTYEINPSVMVNKNSMIYASYSTGFNAPSLYRLYSPSANYISDVKRGNEKLRPETSTSIEFGIKQSIKKFSFTLSVFRTEINDLIEYIYLWDKAIETENLGSDWLRDDYRGDTYINIGEQINKGFEISIRSKLNDKITVAGNISLINGSLIYKPENIKFNTDYHVQLFSTGDFLNKQIEKAGLTRRSNTGNLYIGYNPFKKIFLSADLKYVGSKSDVFYNSDLGPYGALGKTGVSDYSLIGFSVRYQFIKNLFASFRIDNILDTKYQEINGYSTRGRGFFIKLNYSI